MSKTIAFMGKGGTGKTTLAALFLKYVLANGVAPVLVIDADPNYCLGPLLALSVDMTIGDIKHDLKKMQDEPGMTTSKHDYCDYAIQNSLIESTGFDIITMGRPDGPGCYCYVNNVIKQIVSKLWANYAMVIVDCEAGLEHLSRQTIGSIDNAFVVSDMSRKGVVTGINQINLMADLGITPQATALVVNNVRDIDRIDEVAALITTGAVQSITYAGHIRNDTGVLDIELAGESLLSLADDSPAYADLCRIMEKNVSLNQ